MNMPLKVLELETKPVELPFDRLRQSGVVVRMGDPQAAMALLDQLLVETDPAEDRETFAFLKQAINQHRATVGARLMFPARRR